MPGGCCAGCPVRHFLASPMKHLLSSSVRLVALFSVWLCSWVFATDAFSYWWRYFLNLPALQGKGTTKSGGKESALKEWIWPHVGDESEALCRFCKCAIRAHHADLIQHASTEKHKKTPPTLTITDIGFTASKQNETRRRSEPLPYPVANCTALLNHAITPYVSKDKEKESKTRSL